MVQLIAGLAGVGLVGALGFAIYAIVLQRANGRLFEANVNLKVDIKSEQGQRQLIANELAAYKQLVEELEAEENFCVIDPNTAERLPPGSIRDRIDGIVRAHADGVRAGLIETLDTPDDEDSAMGAIGGHLE